MSGRSVLGMLFLAIGMLVLALVVHHFQPSAPNTAVEHQTANPAYAVKQLFEHDGCTVYRFYDPDAGRSVHYVKCEQSAHTVTKRREGRLLKTDRVETVRVQR